jgi:hypothetical protein
MTVTRRATAGLAAILGALVLAPVAAGDRVNHAQHIALEPVASAPLQSGFVENIHANGPQIYAQERYVLNHALPSSTFEVHLVAYPFDPSCTSAPVDFGFVTLTTNGAGNGVARRTFQVSDVPLELRDATHGIRWEVRSGATTIYATGCEAVTLD